MSQDTIVNELVINTLTKQQYEAIQNPSSTELYFVTGDNGGINDAILTIQKNGTSVATFSANALNNVTANIEVPTNTNELTNGAGFITSSALSSYQTTANLVTSVSSSSTNSQYPSAKLFYDTVGDIESAINTIRGV